MKVLIVYGTTEGQTRKIADFCDSYLSKLGHSVDIFDINQQMPDLEISKFDAVILAGSVHQRRHQETLELFAFAHRQELREIPTLLISVSLSIAFENGSDEANSYVQFFTETAEFEPQQVALVAGALKFEKYGYYMNHIVEHVVLKDREQITEDREFTDWDRLKVSLDDFIRA